LLNPTHVLLPEALEAEFAIEEELPLAFLLAVDFETLIALAFSVSIDCEDFLA
jgi:hypothetical protein